jgi:hypothetical protein
MTIGISGQDTPRMSERVDSTAVKADFLENTGDAVPMVGALRGVTAPHARQECSAAHRGSLERPRIIPVTLRGAIGVFCAYLVLAIGIQVLVTGAISSDLGAYSDEPAHYVTGIMIKDYVGQGFPRNALTFATEFYNRFPKVALGHWPPGFYLLQLPWLLLVGDSPAAVMTLIALLAGLTAAIFALALSRVVPLWMALGVGCTWLFMPLTMSLAGTIMAEIPLALVTALALAVWHRFLDRQSRADAILFGAIVAAGILIKAYMIGLLLLPVFAGERFNAPRGTYVSRGIAVAIALLFGTPWTFYFLEETRSNALYTGFSLEYTLRAVSFYFTALRDVLGWTMTAGVIIWIGALIAHKTRRNCLAETAAWAVVGFIVVLLVLPAGLEQRYLVPVVLPLLILSTLGWTSLVLDSVYRRKHRWLAAAVIVIATLESVVAHGIPQRHIEGYRRAVHSAAEACDNDCVLLVLSDANGEGALISEAVQLRHRQRLTVLRGTKVLSSSDWLGRHYMPLVHSSEDVLAVFDRYSVDYILLDSSPGVVPETALAADVLARSDFSIASAIQVQRFVDYPTHQRRQTGQVTVYRSHRRSAAQHSSRCGDEKTSTKCDTL